MDQIIINLSRGGSTKVICRVNRALCKLSPEAFVEANYPQGLKYGFQASWKRGFSIKDRMKK